jgi:hypothetical protein
LILTMTPVVIPKTVSQPVLNISLLCAAPQHVFAASPSEVLRQAKPRDWGLHARSMSWPGVPQPRPSYSRLS